MEEFLHERRKRTPFEEENEEPQRVVRDDDEAKSIADTPHLTGDPELDAIELAETDPLKAPLNRSQLG